MLRLFINTLAWQNHLTQSLFYNEMLSISCNLLKTVLKVKSRMVVVVWTQHGYKCIDCSPSWSHGWPAAAAHCLWPASWESVRPHITSSGKDWNSKSELWFWPNVYSMCAIVKSRDVGWGQSVPKHSEVLGVETSTWIFKQCIDSFI